MGIEFELAQIRALVSREIYQTSYEKYNVDLQTEDRTLHFHAIDTMVNATIDFIFRPKLNGAGWSLRLYIFWFGHVEELGVAYDVEKCPKVGGSRLIYDVDEGVS